MAKTFGTNGFIVGADLGEEWYDELQRFLRWMDWSIFPPPQQAEIYDPPGSPSEGQVVLIGGGYQGGGPTTGAFVGHDGEIAMWRDGAWDFISPVGGRSYGNNIYDEANGTWNYVAPG